MKTMLRDSFDVPLCKIQVDENGKVLKRTIVAGPGAQNLIDNGIVANCLLFHAPFLRDKNQWESDAEVSMGNGGYVKGKLNYTKAERGRGGQAVKVNGTLTNDRFVQAATGLTATNTKYVVNGEQTYDPAKKEWVTGKLNIDVSFQISAAGQNGSAKGTMVVGLNDKPRR
jgi:hypothetical protein